MKRLIAVSLVLLPLTACSLWKTTPPEDDTTVVTERPETKNVIYRGKLLPLGASIYMEGTHRLELEDGRFVLLESNGLILDEYLNKDVEVFGSTRATVEGSAIIMKVERVADMAVSSEAEASSSSSSSSEAMSSSSSAPMVASSTAPVVASSAAPVVASSAAPKPSSSVAPVVASSSAAPVISSAASSTNAAFDARVKAMAKVNMDVANWSQQYCAPSHLAFCFPVHKNWWYTSFGATSSSLWHVELSSEELVALGDGPISIVLLSGAAAQPDGTISDQGDAVVGIRVWTNNRHIEIRAPKALQAAVTYITQELKAAPAAASSSAQ